MGCNQTLNLDFGDKVITLDLSDASITTSKGTLDILSLTSSLNDTSSRLRIPLNPNNSDFISSGMYPNSLSEDLVGRNVPADLAVNGVTVIKGLAKILGNELNQKTGVGYIEAQILGGKYLWRQCLDINLKDDALWDLANDKHLYTRGVVRDSWSKGNNLPFSYFPVKYNAFTGRYGSVAVTDLRPHLRFSYIYEKIKEYAADECGWTFCDDEILTDPSSDFQWLCNIYTGNDFATKEDRENTKDYANIDIIRASALQNFNIEYSNVIDKDGGITPLNVNSDMTPFPVNKFEYSVDGMYCITFDISYTGFEEIDPTFSILIDGVDSFQQQSQGLATDGRVVIRACLCVQAGQEVSLDWTSFQSALGMPFKTLNITYTAELQTFVCLGEEVPHNLIAPNMRATDWLDDIARIMGIVWETNTVTKTICPIVLDEYYLSESNTIEELTAYPNESARTSYYYEDICQRSNFAFVNDTKDVAANDSEFATLVQMGDRFRDCDSVTSTKYYASTVNNTVATIPFSETVGTNIEGWLDFPSLEKNEDNKSEIGLYTNDFNYHFAYYYGLVDYLDGLTSDYKMGYDDILLTGLDDPDTLVEYLNLVPYAAQFNAFNIGGNPVNYAFGNKSSRGDLCQRGIVQRSYYKTLARLSSGKVTEAPIIIDIAQYSRLNFRNPVYYLGANYQLLEVTNFNPCAGTATAILLGATCVPDDIEDEDLICDEEVTIPTILPPSGGSGGGSGGAGSAVTCEEIQECIDCDFIETSLDDCTDCDYWNEKLKDCDIVKNCYRCGDIPAGGDISNLTNYMNLYHQSVVEADHQLFSEITVPSPTDLGDTCTHFMLTAAFNRANCTHRYIQEIKDSTGFIIGTIQSGVSYFVSYDGSNWCIKRMGINNTMETQLDVVFSSPVYPITIYPRIANNRNVRLFLTELSNDSPAYIFDGARWCHGEEIEIIYRKTAPIGSIGALTATDAPNDRIILMGDGNDLSTAPVGAHASYKITRHGGASSIYYIVRRMTNQ